MATRLSPRATIAEPDGSYSIPFLVSFPVRYSTAPGTMPDENTDILNADVEFVRSAPPHIRRDFEQMPMKVLLKEGETLFRFFEAAMAAPPSDFWLPLETYHHLRLQTSVPGWAIWSSAGSKSRPAAATFCRATLTRSVYGFRGFVGQGSATMANLHGRSMVWIPGLSAADFFLRYYSLGGLSRP